MATSWVCPLCGDPSEPRNKEDALPQWVREFVAEQSKTRFIGSAWGKAYDGALPPAMKVTIGERCNSWMGATFEVPSRPLLIPLILGECHILEPGEQEAIAHWVAKTALMTELATGPVGRVPSHVFRRFRETGMTPPGSRVLLGSYSGGGTRPDPVPGKIPLSPKQVPSSQGSWVQFSFDPIIGWLVAQFVLPLRRPRLRSSAERRGLLTPIWPPSGRAFEWPTTSMDAGTATLCEQWAPE